jgi:low temperature requirement protein LtrA
VSERRTTPVELLWDLVFVFAVTQVTGLLSHDLTWAGFGRSMIVLALVWWAWSAFVWAANAEGDDDATLRAVLLAAMVLIFITGLAVPEAFEQRATLFAVTYTGVRLLHLGLYTHASRRGNASWAAIAGFGTATLVGMGLLIAGSLVDEPLRIVLWSLALAIDYAGPAWLTRERLRGLQRVAVAHFAERYGLFVIICLGESIVAIGIGAGDQELETDVVVAVTLGLLISVGLWWTYFDRFAAIAEERLRVHDDPVLAAADGYSYLHLLIVAGIIVFAVGAKSAVHDLHEPLSDGARLALCGGVALYLLGHAAFRARMVREASWAKLAAAGALLAVFGLTASTAAVWVAAAVCAVLGALCAAESAQPSV